MLNVGDEQYIRCVNCWQLHTHNKSILDHWNNGACLFYCSICGKSFHDNIKDLKPHFETEHGIKYQTMFLSKSNEVKQATDTVKKSESLKQKSSMQINHVLPELIKKPEPAKVHKKIVPKSEPSYLELGEFRCEPCKRTFIHRKAYRSHYTLKHKKKYHLDHAQANEGVTMPKSDNKTVKAAVASRVTEQSSKNQRKNFGKHWKKRTNEAVMKTVIRKSAKKSKSVAISSKKQSSIRKLGETMMIGETLVQCTTTSTTVTIQKSKDVEVSQDQTVSSTYLPTSGAYNDTDIHIKPEPEPEALDEFEADAEAETEVEPDPEPEPEPLDNFSINYPEVPVQSCNGWIPSQPPPPPPPLQHQQPQYDAWNQNAVDPYIDTSPRLKVKDLTDLQVPNHRYPNESHSYQQNVPYKEQPMIMPNQNMSGLQIQNVQSYQTHSVQPQVQYVDYSCMNSMNTTMNLTDHGMCTSNLYEMHITPPQQIQNTQLINPVFLLPSNSTHAVPDYHY